MIHSLFAHKLRIPLPIAKVPGRAEDLSKGKTMSQPNNERVGSFVSDLVAMAKATERLPGLEAELQRMQMQAIEDGQRIARLERKLIDAKTHEEELNAKLRSVEAERDNAGFRELEATDREDNLKRIIRDFQIAAGELLKATEPVTVPTVAELPAPESLEHKAWEPGQSEFPPTPITATATSTEGQSAHLEEKATAAALANPQEDGELNPRPTVPSTTDPSANSVSAESSNSASTSIQTEAQEVPPQPDPTPPANGQTASAKSTTESASAPPSDDWWPRVNQASNYSG